QRYYFMGDQCCGGGGNGGGGLQFSVGQLVAPGNDNFANATPIGALPFSDTQDLTAATTEPAEPGPGCFSASNTVWYSFTARTTGSITATTNQYGSGIAAYTGNSLASLSQVGCAEAANYYPVTFRAQAGTTYYFQVGGWCCGFGPATFHLAVAPDPVALFKYYPGGPIPFKTTLFYEQTIVPVNAELPSLPWSF